jgi:membrane fusion protein (multidrug efflux system)
VGALVLSGCGRKAASGASAGGGGGAGQKQAVEVVAVKKRDLVETLNLVGSLAANETAQVRAEVAGVVREVRFNEGERVVNGQVLLKVDDSELRAQLAQAEARFRLAELNFQRSENLSEQRSMSQAEADRFRSEFAATTAELSLLRVRLDKTEIKAPFAGVAGARSISPGDYVTAATVITTIDDLSRLKADFQVPERFAGKVKQGTPFGLRATAREQEIKASGEVYFVASVIDRSTRSVQVKGLVAADSAGLKPGMFANIELVLEQRAGALTVPEGAILATARGAQVIAVKDAGGEKTADFVSVRTGLRARGFVEVEPLQGGLDEGREVVAAGVGALILFPGAKLDPKPARPEFQPAD